MSRHDNAHENVLDRAIEAVRNEPVDAAAEAGAAARVWARLSREAAAVAASPAAPSSSPSAAAEGPASLRTCADYRALIPAYLAGELAPARALLLEDHGRECLPCRKAIKEARSGHTAVVATPVRRSLLASAGARRGLWLAAAALLAVAVGVSGMILWDNLGSGGGAAIAQVRSVDGALLRVSGSVARPALPGESIAAGEEVRTAKGSGAVVRLSDGSLVEMRERSAISLAERRSETTIRVARGSIIVQAAKQHGKHLYVATEDCLVSVTGTIFAVNHGTKGSRVSVIEGEVRVEHGRDENVLHPGDQVTTLASLAKVPVADEISWSRDVDHYRALLAELTALRHEIDTTVSHPELRHASRLLDLVPAGTAVYLAVPNLSESLAEANSVLGQRLAASQLLSDWWQRQVAAGGTQQLDDLVSRLRDFGEHLGDEVVVALPMDAAGKLVGPVALAEVTRPVGFHDALAGEVDRLNREAGGEPRLRIVSDPLSASGQAGDGAGGTAPHQVLLWADGDLFVATPSAALLAEVARAALQPGSNGFVGSPFHQRLAESYSNGVELLAGLDAGSVLARLASGEAASRPERTEVLAASGLLDADYLVVERRELGDGRTYTGAVLSFERPRRGVAAWLAAPAPMGSLEYVSPDASFAAAFVLKSPASMLDEVERLIGTTDPGLRQHLSDFESEHGINLLDDVAAPLGGELTFALDGPVLPKPAWKLVVEVYDPARLQQAIETAVGELDRAATDAGKGGLTLTSEVVGDRTYYTLRTAGDTQVACYTFTDGYLVAAPDRTLVDRALQVRSSRASLPESAAFRALLPEDGYSDFSALVFDHLGPLFDSLLSQLRAGAGASGGADQVLSEARGSSAPTLTYAYGEADRIRVASSGEGGILGSRLGVLLGLGHLTGSGGGR